jgi:GT2 family glycosyltransferase
MKIAVAVATAGRPEILAQTLQRLNDQTRVADRIVVCPAKPSDFVAPAGSGPSDFTVVHGRPGLPAQRNSLLKASQDMDVVVFFDDDFFAQDDYLAAVETLFAARPEIVMATGHVIADGILGPGIPTDEAVAVLAADRRGAEEITPVANGYGCNMAVRMAPVRERVLEFDEALPLYGWLEDVDFSRRLAPAGMIVRSTMMRGVHLGHKGGRSSGVRLGYSQVANPFYMVRKGSLGTGRALTQVARNLLANGVKTMRPEPWVDRRGRLVGNAMAIADALRGRMHPQRILSL